MNRGKELIKNTTIIFIGRFCTQILSFLLLPFYTAILNTDEYGTVDLIITYVSLAVPCITLELSSALFRFIVEKRKFKEDLIKIISFVMLTVTLISIIFCIFLYTILSFIGYKYTFAVLILIITSTYSNVSLQMARGFGDYISYSISSVIIAGITIFLNIIFLTVFKMGAVGIIFSMSIANFIGILFVFFKIKIWKYIKINSKFTIVSNEMLKYSIPLIPNSIIWWIINVSDRSIISGFIGIAANGIYAIATKFPSIISILFSVVNISWQESVSLHINDEDSHEFISRAFNKLLELFSSLCIGMISVMWFIFPIMINVSYKDAYNYIPILVIASYFNVVVSLLGGIYIGLKKTKDIATTSFLAGLINFFTNIFLVKKIGIYAAAISTLLAFVCIGIYRVIDINKIYKIKIDRSRLFTSAIVATIIIFIYYINILLLNIIGVVIAVVYTIYSNLDIMKRIYNKRGLL